MSKAVATYGARAPSLQDHLRFLFEGLEVRAVDREGKPWFVGKDVCAVLGHTNARMMLGRLPESERATVKIPDALGRDRDTTIISLAGVFRLVLTSRVEGAERFQAWLTDEILPTWYVKGAEPQPAPTLTTREADLSALTDAVSSLVPALAAITTTLAALAGRVEALETRSTPAELPSRDEAERQRRMLEQRREAGRKGGLAKAANKAARLAAAETPPALPVPTSAPFTAPTEWSGVPVEDIINENLHLAGAGSWLYAVAAELDREVHPAWTFRPGVTVRGTRIHPGPGAYAWTSGSWIHVHVSVDIWRPHRDGDPRATWLIGQIVDRYQRHVEALRIVEAERRKLPKNQGGRHPQVSDEVGERAARSFQCSTAAH